MNTFNQRYEHIINELMEDDRNGTWDEILEDKNFNLNDALDLVIDALKVAVDDSDAEGKKWYVRSLVKAKLLRRDIKMNSKTLRVSFSMPAEDVKKLYAILEHSYLSNRDVYLDLDADDPLRRAAAFAGVMETVYHEQTGEYVREMLEEWSEFNTGGNCMVWYKDFRCTDGKIRMVGVNDEGFSLYRYSYNEYWIDDSEKEDNPCYAEDVMMSLLDRTHYLEVCAKRYSVHHE